MLFNLKYIYGASTPLTEKEGQKTAFTPKNFFHDNFNWSKKMTNMLSFLVKSNLVQKLICQVLRNFKKTEGIHDTSMIFFEQL